MGLRDLLINPDSFELGVPVGEYEGGTPEISANQNLSYGGPSKSIVKYGLRAGETNTPSYHLVDRVSWNVSDSNAEPTFLIGNDHYNGNNDYILRGGAGVNLDRRNIDTQRITNFLFNSPKGSQFLLRQGALQLLNPQKNQRVFNAGVNLLAQIAVSGVAHLKREGIQFIDEDGYIDYLKDEPSFGQSKRNLVGRGREEKYNLGDAGKATSKGVLDVLIGDNPFKKKTSYNVPIKDSVTKIDKLNLLGIINATNGIPDSEFLNNSEYLNDFVPFRIEVVNSLDPTKSKIIAFRTFNLSVGDSYTANHTTVNYNGRGEDFYIYNSFGRSISLGFTIAAQSRYEMQPLYKKANYLAAQCAPEYNDTSGRMMTPIHRLTLGDWFRRLPGVINSVTLDYDTNVPWETKNNFNDQDNDMAILPHALNITLKYQPIHNFIPRNSDASRFIGWDQFNDGNDSLNENGTFYDPSTGEENGEAANENAQEE